MNHCLDGHGRLKALRLLATEGWEIPPLPIVHVNPANEQEARGLIVVMNNLPYNYNMKELRQFVADNQLEMDFGAMHLYQVNPKDLLIEHEFVRPDFTDTAQDQGSTKNNRYFYVEYYADAKKYNALVKLFNKAGILTSNNLNADAFYKLIKEAYDGAAKVAGDGTAGKARGGKRAKKDSTVVLSGNG